MFLQRFIAILLILIPGFAATYGWKLMRDTIFFSFSPPANSSWWVFAAGLLLFIGGIAFLSGYIYFRDQKRRRIKREKLKKLRRS